MLGHTLRMTDDTPAKHAMLHYFDKTSSSFLGRPRTTLPLVIDKDLKLAAKQPPNTMGQFELPNQLKTINDLRRLEALASDRKEWMNLVSCVTYMQVPEPPAPITRTRPRRNEQQ